MKHNWKSVLSEITEYIVLIAPTVGYQIYCYTDTLQHTMSNSSKGAFWTLISAAILAAVLYKLAKKRYDRFVQGWVQQKTDLETKPDDALLIEKVYDKAKVIENLDYLFAALPILILLTVVAAFQTAIEQLIILLEVMAASLFGKIALHTLTIHLEKTAMLKPIKKDGE